MANLTGGCACGAVRYRLASGPMFVRSEMPTDSGRPHGIYRCPTCGVALWSEYGGVETLRLVRVGTLDDPHALRPDVHIYTRSKQPWVTLPAGVPAFEAYYESSKLWPAESLARRAAAFAAKARG